MTPKTLATMVVKFKDLIMLPRIEIEHGRFWFVILIEKMNKPLMCTEMQRVRL